MATVVFEGVWKVFRGNAVALRSIDLEIHDGELFVFLGPSGSGKTTLLRTIAGLDKPSAGRILVAGRDVTELTPKERNIAMVFQNHSLYPHMNVYDNIAFGIQARRLKKAELDARVRRTAQLLDIEELLKRKPRTLSGGQQQRVAIARAIVRDPDAFLMDEPLSNLDARTRLHVRGELARIQRAAGATTIYVTHDQNEALTLGDRVGVLRDGVLEQVAPPARLYRDPGNLFVAGFVGSPPMNLAEATVEEADDGLFLRFSKQRVRVDEARGLEGVRRYAWRQVVVGVRPEDLDDAASLGRLGVDDATGIGLSGQMHGLVALDARLDVLRPAILWNDQRTAAECEQIEERVGRARLVELTGNRALTGFTAPKLLWLRANEPETYRRIAHVLLPKDYVRLKLTGELAADVTDASGTLLFDVARRRWSDEVVDALELDAGVLPSALESPEVSGRTAAGVPVAAGAGDQAAGAVGVGVDRPGALSVALGTSGVVFAALPELVVDERARLHVFCHALPGAWHAMGVMLSAAGSLTWFHDALGDGASYDVLMGEAARWEPGVEGLVFLPYLAGERTPHADPGARASFTGLSLRHDRGALVRAVLEGVAYGLRDSLELARALGVEADRARVSGGGSRSELWLRVVASVLGIPLEVTAVEEGAAFGAALLGAVAGGEFDGVGDAVDACVSVQRTIEPVDAWRDAYDEGYATFRALYPALAAVRRAGARP